jgi:tetratricopeptide (TPR) repeat protein
VPFGGSAPRADRDRVVNRLYAALTEWRGLSVASDQDVNEATLQAAPRSSRAAADIARSVGAGRLIWGQMNADDPSRVRVELFDVSSNVPRKSVWLGAAADSAAMRAAVLELLKIPNRPAAADGGDGRTSSYAAWTDYARGHAAIANGDFAAAEQNFRNAAGADPDFGPPRIWLSQIQAWRAPDLRADWREQVSQGLASPSGLSERDRLIGTAVMRLADRRYPEACAGYSRLTAADSLDFVSLYGLGQCQALDSLVIRSTTSASGWRFRSRYSDAAGAYMRALRLNPNAHSIFSFEQLQDLLPTASNKTRRGNSIDGQEFAAYAMLVRDTVVFVPYPLAQFANLPADQTVSARNAAIDADLRVLSDFATDWTRRAPTSSPAFLALAEVQEARGEIDRTRSGTMSAIDAVAKARSVAATPHDSLLATSKEAWLRFKQGDFGRARALADSLMQATTSHRDEAAALIGLAALTGKIGKTSELARLTHDYAASATDLAVPIMDAAAPFFAFAALGVCTDTIHAVERRLDDALAHFVAESQLAQVRRAVKARPLSMLAPCTNAKSSLGIDANNKLLNLQRAYATNDQRTLKVLLAKVTEDARTQRPGDISLEHTYQVAWLRAAMGDTIAAERQLDRALGALPSLSAVSLKDAASAAAAGRAMALRAELANARGETDDRKKWSRAVAELWATADAPLQPQVTRMKSLASQSNRK